MMYTPICCSIIILTIGLNILRDSICGEIWQTSCRGIDIYIVIIVSNIGCLDRTIIHGTENEGVFNFFIGGTKMENPEDICANDESIRDAIKKHIGHREDIKIGESSWTSPHQQTQGMLPSLVSAT